MFDDTTLGPQVLSNPAMVQSMVLTELQNRLGGIYSVADPNNGFNIQLEASSSMTAQSVRYMESAFAAQYPVRATTSAELYNSMSDFDYLNMVAGPASTTLNLTFGLDYLIANAVSYDATYNRVVIPAITQFYVGPLTFGIYYPINININKVTNNINVLWDTTALNPLFSLSTNMVPFSQYTYGGLNLLTLQIPVSQFVMNTSTFPVVSQQGFIKNLTYADQFYAVRVFTNLPSGSWTELSYTLSETVYDPTTPTAKITIQNDVNTVTVSIPQIYFTNNQIGNQVQVVLLTTKGEITLDLTSVELSTCNVSFGLTQPGVTQYSAILSNLSTISLVPAENVVTGGSNALSFTQLRNLIVNGGLYTSAPVTPAQLDAFSLKNGFTISKYIDNITNRIYFASNTIEGGQNGYVMVTTGNLNVTANVSLTTSSILSFPTSNSITILPTTTYSFDEATSVCTPLTDAQLAYLNGLTGQNFVNEVNTNIYVRCPFHLVTYTSSQYPITKSFNLMQPTAGNIQFITDNTSLTPQMSLTSGAVVHNNNGTGGYTLRLGVVKNPAMIAIAENNITVCLTTTDAGGNIVYGTATLTATTTSLYIYEMSIPTNYNITENGTIQTTLKQLTSGESVSTEINLTSTFTVIFLLNASLYPLIGQNSDVINNVPTVYNTLLGVSRQTVSVTLGIDLSDQIYNITNATWSSTTYATYPETVYLTYANDVYQKQPNGALVYTIVGADVQLVKLSSAGDPVLNQGTVMVGLPYQIEVVNGVTTLAITFPPTALPDGTTLSPSFVGRVFGLTNFSESGTPSGTYPVVSVSGNTVTFNVIGFPTSGSGTCNVGNPIVQYPMGSVKLDPYGNPIVMNSRSLSYYVKSMMFDLRLFYSQNPQDLTFVAGLPGILNGYASTVATLQNSLLEQTQLYYVPNSTMGTAVFSAGNNTPITLNLGFSFGVTVYVAQSILSSTTSQASITADITSIIQQEMTNSIISLTDIAQNIKTQLSDSISSVDVLGIDGTNNLQTVIVPAGTTNPIIAQQLVWNNNTNTMNLQPAITVNFSLAA